MAGSPEREVLYENRRYRVFKDGNGQGRGEEKPHRALKDDKRLSCAVSQGDWKAAVWKCLEELDAFQDLDQAGRVAVKINLGGGILGCPATYTDVDLLEALVEILQERGLFTIVRIGCPFPLLSARPIGGIGESRNIVCFIFIPAHCSTGMIKMEMGQNHVRDIFDLKSCFVE